ncbi:MAG: DUF4350 domain-containing protein [Hyphomicrobiales bacterium]
MNRRSTISALGITIAILCLAAAAPPSRAIAQPQQLDDSTFVPTVAAPAFTKRHPTVLFDEAHHDFHTLEGRYRAFAALLRADGFTLTPNKEPFTAKSLAGHDLLVIANAMGDDPETGNDSTVALPAFTPEEVAAVHAWVEGGGSLLLIADHSPFGSAAAALGAAFGVDMSRGYACDSTQAFSGSMTNLEFTRERKTLGDHPIVNGRIPKERLEKVVAFTGESLRGPAGSTPILLLSDDAFDLPPAALRLRADPEAMMKEAVPAKGRSMAVALAARRGRVVVQGEAGMLAAQVIVFPDGREPVRFGMNRAGLDNQQYALNLARWLARAE